MSEPALVSVKRGWGGGGQGRESSAETGGSAVTPVGKGLQACPPSRCPEEHRKSHRPPSPASAEDGASPSPASVCLAALGRTWRRAVGLTGLQGPNRAASLMPQVFPECPLRAQEPAALRTG